MVRGTYHEMPGLSLSLQDARRLFGLPADTCRVVLPRRDRHAEENRRRRIYERDGGCGLAHVDRERAKREKGNAMEKSILTAAKRAVVRTTGSGSILWINDAAARMLNLGQRAAPGRNLLTFFNGGRVRLQQELVRASTGQVCELKADLRPRERRPLGVRIDLTAAEERGEIEWLMEPANQ